MKNKALVVCLLAAPLLAQRQPADHVLGRLLVQHRTGVNPDLVAQVATRVGARVEGKIPQINMSVLRLPEAAADRVAAALLGTGLFTFVEPDYLGQGSQTVQPNDPSYISQWHLSKIQGPSAWAISTGSSSVTIAVIDSGADPMHPDLGPKLTSGWSFLTGTSNTADTLGHGTAVAGTAAAATNNATGVAGVAWANKIMPLVVLNSSNYASYSNIASAITYAADHGVRIMNISISGSSSSSTLQSAVNYAWNKGAVIFAAAGNQSTSSPQYPAACTNVVAVSATDGNDAHASFSNYGSWIDVSAPGTSILTTANGSSYGYWQGTSFASPIAAAVAALALSVQPTLSNTALVSLLQKNSDDLGPAGWDQYYGYGRMNAYKVVAAAKNAGSTLDTTAPSVSISSPGTGSTVSGTIAVQGSDSDNVGVTSVQFYVDGVLATSSTGTSFSFSWNTSSVSNSTHSLTVKAYDAAGNAGSASVSVTVSNTVAVQDTLPPVVSISNPAGGSRVGGNVKITASATDNVGVTQVSIYIDNVLTCTTTAAPYTCTWNTRKAAAGSHAISARAWDRAGNVGYSLPITVYK